MKAYHINIFYSEEDGGYIADIPDLKYCSTFGETDSGVKPCYDRQSNFAISHQPRPAHSDRASNWHRRQRAIAHSAAAQSWHCRGR